MRTLKAFTLLSAVAANTTGTLAAMEGTIGERFTAVITAASVTTGATVNIQIYCPLRNAWTTVDTATYAANGDTVIQWPGPIFGLRATVTNYTDGTFTVEAHVLTV